MDSFKKKYNHLKYVSSNYWRCTYRLYRGKNHSVESPYIIGMIRERNESLILKDTLDHMSQFVDGIIVFDDCSSDKSVAIAKDHPAVIEVVVRKKWQKSNREWTETVDRNILIKYAKKYSPEWLFYADADERFEGNIKSKLKEIPDDIEGIQISLFDAYITEKDRKPYQSKDELLNFRKYFGPERRDILMIWRNRPNVWFRGPIARIPRIQNKNQVTTDFYCQHYGKSLSIEQWEETCNYYVKHFPKYRDKWQARKGKAIHKESDFGRKLYVWDEVKKHSTEM